MINANNLSQLPKGWEWVELGNVCKTTSGGTPSRKKTEFFNGNIPWLKSGELNNGTIFRSEEFITEQGLADSSAKIFPKDTLLIALYGATVGKLGILGIDAATNQAICGIFPFINLATKYLFWYLYSIRDELLKNRIGGAQPNISQSILRIVNIPLPHLTQQERIVAKIEELFTRLDAGVAELQQAKLRLKRYRQAVLKAAVEGNLSREWHKVSNPSLDTNENILIKIPDEWEWTTVAEVSKSLQYGTSEKANKDTNGIPVLRMGNIQNGELDFSNLKYMPKNWEQLDKYLLQDGDVIFNRTNSAELVGKTAVYKKQYPPAVFASYLIRVDVITSLILPNYLSFVVNSSYGRHYISSVVSQQVGQANVNGTKLSQMPIPKPPLVEQQIIIDKVESRLSLADVTEKEIEQAIQRAERLRQSILKAAFEGRLVPQNPHDEAASVLLERNRSENINQSSQAKPSRSKGKAISSTQTENI